MAKNKTINEFLDDTIRVYGFSGLDDLRRRELRFKLALADIKDVVRPEDTSLALDLVLAEMQPKTASGSLRTASASMSRTSPCPRCKSVMGGVKLSNSCDALYCSSCHVTVPVK
jgi:hypothetical protein